jgi:tRNA threonylcarbamoyladenosine biosynthesis protein TsaE
MTDLLRLDGIDLAALPDAARSVADLLPSRGTVLFEGEMGAGKTTLIAALCAVWGVDDDVSSPTYALVNEYCTAAGGTVYHFDLYRLDDPEEALAMGIEEYFADDALSLVEWPERLGGLRPEDAWVLHIEDREGLRTIRLAR